MQVISKFKDILESCDRHLEWLLAVLFVSSAVVVLEEAAPTPTGPAKARGLFKIAVAAHNH